MEKVRYCLAAAVGRSYEVEEKYTRVISVKKYWTICAIIQMKKKGKRFVASANKFWTTNCLSSSKTQLALGSLATMS